MRPPRRPFVAKSGRPRQFVSVDSPRPSQSNWRNTSLSARSPAQKRLAWPDRILLIVAIIVAGYAAKKLFLPDISDAVWNVLMLMSVAVFLVDVVRHRGERRGLQALFALLGGLVGLLTYLIIAPLPVLKWLYDFTGSPQGSDDIAAARIIMLLIGAWLVHLMTQVRRKVRHLDSPQAESAGRQEIGAGQNPNR